MDDEKIVKLSCAVEEHGRRLDKLETVTDDIQRLTLNIERLAMNMQTMLAEVQKQGERLNALESIPKERGRVVWSSVVTALIGGVIGAILAKVLPLL